MPANLSRIKPAQVLFELATASVAFFSDPAGNLYAAIPNSPVSHLTVPINSAVLQDCVFALYAQQYTQPTPTNSAWHAALRRLRAEARLSRFPPHPVDARLSADSSLAAFDAIHLHLGNPDGESVAITPNGWSFQPVQSQRFLFNPQSLPLPHPQPDAPPLNSLLANLLRLPEHAHQRALCWLVAATRPSGPFPILILKGAPASGKSTTARILRQILDPTLDPLARLPNTPRQLEALAAQNRVLSFDHVTHISRAQSEALCRCGKPVVLTAPSRLTLDPELSSRALTIDLPAIAPEQRRFESDLALDLHHSKPAILGALCSAISIALKRVATIPATGLPRFADATAWVLAAEPALGLTSAEILSALSTDDTPQPLTRTLEHFMQGRTSWTGTATDLLFDMSQAAALPDNPTALGMSLRQVRSPLIEATFKRTNRGSTRQIVLTYIGPPESGEKVSSPASTLDPAPNAPPENGEKVSSPPTATDRAPTAPLKLCPEPPKKASLPLRVRLELFNARHRK